MNAEERRSEILKRLKHAKAPVSAAKFARELDVSRQIIVGDIALLRAGGEQIQATPKGYVLPDSKDEILFQIACCHSREQMKEELYLLVDEGCVVKDVIVEHPLYGELTGQLNLHSRKDVDDFIRRGKDTDALPLSALTEGVHLHTVSCRDESTKQEVIEKLRTAGILYEDR